MCKKYFYAFIVIHQLINFNNYLSAIAIQLGFPPIYDNDRHGQCEQAIV